ncbi:MAG: peptidoglycan DD-metalloendopeptidase family protein [Actinomycetota bacterium]
MPLRRPVTLTAALAVLLGALAVPAGASADDATVPEPTDATDGTTGGTPTDEVPEVVSPFAGHQLPFGCGEGWTGTTRRKHSPSRWSIDFNRDRDLGRLVVASAAGVVSRVQDTGNRSYGKWVQVTHAGGYSTVYAHLSAQWVAPGQFVDQGTPIGRVGATGGVSGPHLHYEQRLGNDVMEPWFAQLPFAFGGSAGSQNCPDVPLAGDWNGDRAAEVAVFRRQAGAGTFELYTGAGEPAAVRLGRSVDLPVTGDWDGDGVTDVGVRRQLTRVFFLRTADGAVTRKRFGIVKDVPVAGDWDGDGKAEVGVWRPAAARFRLLQADGTQRVVRLGSPSSQPLTGDWNGDGTTDVGVFDSSSAMFTLRAVSSDGLAAVTTVLLGASTDLPVTGDWNGDGITDVGTWTPSTATYTLRITPPVTNARQPAGSAAELRTLTFGTPR